MKRSACPRLSVTVHPGAEKWAPSRQTAQKIACLLSRDVAVEYAPRSMLEAIWQRDHGSPLPVDRYAFRAYARGGRAVLFVDETETPASATWLLLHELAHLDLPNSRLLFRAYRSVDKPDGYLTDDVAHEAHPEEQMANLVADQVLPTLGYPAGRYDRLWWRRRVASRRAATGYGLQATETEA